MTEMKTEMITFVIALALASMVLGGCQIAPLQASKTTAEVEFADGRMFRYESNKEQAGIDATIHDIDPDTGTVIRAWRLLVEKSGTPQAAYEAMVQQQRAIVERDKAITDLIRRVLEQVGDAAPGP